MRIEWNDGDLEGSDVVRPDDALGVVALLDAGRHDATDADAIAAHDHHNTLAILIQHFSVHRLAVPGSQLENVTDFDAALDGKRALAIRAQVVLAHPAQVRGLVEAAVAAPVRIHHMLAVDIGSADKI